MVRITECYQVVFLSNKVISLHLYCSLINSKIESFASKNKMGYPAPDGIAQRISIQTDQFIRSRASRSTSVQREARDSLA